MIYNFIDNLKARARARLTQAASMSVPYNHPSLESFGSSGLHIDGTCRGLDPWPLPLFLFPGPSPSPRLLREVVDVQPRRLQAHTFTKAAPSPFN